jgi:hypothetical protein
MNLLPKVLKRMGYDGIFYHGKDPIKDAFTGEVYREPHDQWGAFHPDQITKPDQEPEEGAPPAPGPAQGVSFMPGATERPLSKQTLAKLGPRPEDPVQQQLYDRVSARLDSQVKGAIPLEPDRDEDGDFKFTKTGEKDNPKYNPNYKKVDYAIANSPMLQKAGKALGTEINSRTGKVGMAKPPKDVQDDIKELDPEKRLTPFLNPTDRKRVAHLNDMSAVDAYADKLHGLYKSIEHLPDVMAGKNWYDEAADLLRQHFGKHADMVANLLGATSAGNAVKINYNMAMEAYHQFLRGAFDKHIDLYRKAYGIREGGEGALMKHVTDEGIHAALGEEAPKTDAAAMDQYIAHHDIVPRSSGGKLFGHNSGHVLKVLAHTWEEEAGGPKTPNFAGNLSGRSLQATIDMWSARTMRRLGHEGYTKKPWLIQPAGETGVNDVDFGLSQLAFKKAADRIGIKPSALQAILWFNEQRHWQANKWEREQDPNDRDYRPMLRAYQRPENVPVGAYQRELHGGPPEAPGALHMQTGGLVPGNGDEDSVPAMLTPGELVVPRPTVDAMGPQNLDALSRTIQGYPPPIPSWERQSPGSSPWETGSEIRQDIPQGPDRLLANVRYNNPGSIKEGPSSRRFGSTTYGIIANGNHISRFDTPEQGAAAQFDLLDSPTYVNRSVSDVMKDWTGANKSDLDTYVKALGVAPDTIITHDFLRSPAGIALAKQQAVAEGRGPYPMNDEQWQQAQDMAYGGEPSSQ